MNCANTPSVCLSSTRLKFSKSLVSSITTRISSKCPSQSSSKTSEKAPKISINHSSSKTSSGKPSKNSRPAKCHTISATCAHSGITSKIPWTKPVLTRVILILSFPKCSWLWLKPASSNTAISALKTMTKATAGTPDATRRSSFLPKKPPITT